jgi:hypothetical protein
MVDLQSALQGVVAGNADDDGVILHYFDLAPMGAVLRNQLAHQVVRRFDIRNRVSGGLGLVTLKVND